MTEAPTLDEDQLAAAGITIDERQIVLASPGCGKTEVVAALVARISDDLDVSPVDEVLAISFSRAAVSALRRRLSVSGAPMVHIRTLDSLASRLLEELDDEGWQSLDFDGRIARAITLLESGRASEELQQVRHLIVDEVQDLVGVRARLVLALMKRLPPSAGFTLLGDPNQAVYDFQLENDVDLRSAELLATAEEMGAVRRTLTVQYRARTPEAKSAAALGEQSLDADQWLQSIRSFTSKIFMAGDVADLAGLVCRWSGTTAFLCRSNGVARIVHSSLRDAGVRASLRAAADEQPVAPWVATALSGVASRLPSREEVHRALVDLAPLSPDEAWRLLKEVERDYRSPDKLDLRKLARRIALRDVPAALLDSESTTVVSTIHRAKGLEFDNVVLINPDDLLPGSVEAGEAAVAYVALTRARDQLMGASCELPRGLRMDRATGRWLVAGYQSWQTFAFEVRGSDTRTLPDVEGLEPHELPAVGDEVAAQLDPLRSTMEVPVYELRHEGKVVARTTDSFGELLARRIGTVGRGRRNAAWPGLSGLAVEAWETVAFPDESTASLRVGIRAGGIATLDWPRKERDKHG